MTNHLSEYVTVTEAAQIEGVSRRAVLHRITSGRLPAVKLGRNTSAYLVRRSDLPKREGRPE